MARTPDPDVKLLAALADPIRLSIVRQLAECDGVCACDFTDSRDISQPTVSHHLRVLREAGVVTAERRGSNLWYRLAPEAVGQLSALSRSLVPGDFVPASDLGTNVRMRREISPRTRSKTARRSSSEPVASAGSSKPQWSVSRPPGKYGHDSRARSQTVTT